MEFSADPKLLSLFSELSTDLFHSEKALVV